MHVPDRKIRNQIRGIRRKGTNMDFLRQLYRRKFEIRGGTSWQVYNSYRIFREMIVRYRKQKVVIKLARFFSILIYYYQTPIISLGGPPRNPSNFKTLAFLPPHKLSAWENINDLLAKFVRNSCSFLRRRYEDLGSYRSVSGR